MAHFLRKMAAAWMILGSVSVGFAQQQMPPIPTDPNVRIGKLDNGLTYYIRHNELPEQRANFYIAQKVGSILEEDNQRGLAHFLEHMCFNGTKNFPGKGIINYLETIGVRFGENLNAYTSVDETVYNIDNVPVIRDGIVDSCLLILHDWANDLTLADKEIDNERGVIHEEWRTGQGAMMRMYEKAFPTIYGNSRYGHRLPIGTMEVIDNFPYQALRDYYEKWYRPDQQGIIVVGDIDVDKVEGKIKELFAPIPMPANAAKREYFPVNNNKEAIVTIEKDKEQTNNVIYLFHKHDAVPNEAKGTMDYLVMDYLKAMTGTMINARLEELRQSPEPPFVYAGAEDSNFFLSKTKDAFLGLAVAKDGGIETALGSLVREIERMRQFGFTASEYARAKADYLRQLESAYNERTKMKNGEFVQEYVDHFLDNEPIPGIDNEYAIMNQIVPNIPVEAVNAILPTLVCDSNMVVSLFCPDKEGTAVPTEAAIRDVLAKVKAEKLTAYEDKVSNEPLMAEAPKGGKVVKTEDGPFNSKILTLSNGVRVIVKTTDFKADEIRMKAFSPGGSSLFPDSEAININALNAVATIGGIGNFSKVNLEKVLAGKKASVSARIGSLTEGVNGYCSPKDFETLMQLTYLTFTAPRTDQDAFTSYVNRTKAALENAEANPMMALQDSLMLALYNGHPRAISMKAPMVDKIDYSKVMQMYADRFKDASDFTFLFVGNINLAEVTPLIETYLGGLPVTHRKETYADNKMDIRQGEYKNVFEKKLETPKATVLIFHSGTCEFTLKNQLMLTMLKQVLDMVYVETVREQEGGTYGVGVGTQMDKYPRPEMLLQIQFDTDPAKRAKMVEIIDRELTRIADEGPAADKLTKVKEFLLKKHAESTKENTYWMGALNNYFQVETDMVSGYEATVNAITPADIQSFTKALLDQKNRIEVSMTCNETK